MSHAARTIPSPVGDLTLIAEPAGLVAVLWPEERAGRVALPSLTQAELSVLREAERQLFEYFAGERRAFDLPLAPRGTPFQQRVWAALRAIPFGETRSYREIAVAIGQPAATRAVGAANGRNPLSIVTPCHRVIGARGALTGFAGGLAIKRHLLGHEAHLAGRVPQGVPIPASVP